MDPNHPTIPEKDTKNAKIMLGVFGALTLLFVCGGGAAVGVAASGSESDGMAAAMAATGPACCALSGLATSLLALLAFPTQKGAQIAAPIIAAVAGGLFGGLSIALFFAVIWPSL